MLELDAHTVGDVLKLFLRLLPHPLIPVEEFFGHFLTATQIENKQYHYAFLGSLVKSLPLERRELLSYLCKFFFKIVNHSTENMMGASNLSIIFAPAFFGQSLTTDSSRILAETKATSSITQTLIENYPDIFQVCREIKKKYLKISFLTIFFIKRMNMSQLKF